MRLKLLICAGILFPQLLVAQKKSLDHSVYDSWETIGMKAISKNGQWAFFSVDPQEGDNKLYLKKLDGTIEKLFPRGYKASFTPDNKFLVFKISPLYIETRAAKIKKKKADEMPKDSLGVYDLAKDILYKYPSVRSFSIPEKGNGWIAFQYEKSAVTARKKVKPLELKNADSLSRSLDSMRILVDELRNRPGKKRNRDDDAFTDAEGDDSNEKETDSASVLMLLNLSTNDTLKFPNTLTYRFDKPGAHLLVYQAKDPEDSMSKPNVVLRDLKTSNSKIISLGGNKFKNFVFSSDGSQLAFVAERDSKPKDLQKFYKLWYYKDGMDTATMLVQKNSAGIDTSNCVTDYGILEFSESGKRLFFPVAPIQAPKDTTLIEIDQVKLDIWNYKDDYLQTAQLFRLKRDQALNFLSVYDFTTNKAQQLETLQLPTVYKTMKGDGTRFVGVTDFGKRIESQWTGNTLKDIYVIDPSSGSKKLIKSNLDGMITPSLISPSGEYIGWYDRKVKAYFAFGTDSAKNISKGVGFPLFEEDNDVPDYPSPYGAMGWMEDNSALLVYDKYDVWKLSADGTPKPQNITQGNGRKTKVNYRYFLRDPEQLYVAEKDPALFRRFDFNNRLTSLAAISLDGKSLNEYQLTNDKLTVRSNVSRDEMSDSGKILFNLQSVQQSPNVFMADLSQWSTYKQKLIEEKRLSMINPQQDSFNWQTAEIYKWKTFKGKPAQGILYKPENFDPSKKYPVILYFYEKLSDSIHNYMPPAPTPSRLNIPFFVSRGYLVLAPDIEYVIGHPAQSAYDFIVSGAKDLAKNKWVDAANMGIQGQSWGGIQVAQLITMTTMFKAAWAGAPVANMTSAYGGIRWESGLNRQMQYEKTQSRIGATLWEKPELYIENSPLFHLPKVKTPLVIMSNDADGAVPWYQGIELFTAMRRLGQKVWLLNYNGEAHNLVQRKNRKDIQIREQQYFDWLLKGAEPTKWITEGVPSVQKGKEWGLK